MSTECVLGFERLPRPTISIPATVEEARAYYLGFGKYNGQLITTVPWGYLMWLAGDTPSAVRMPPAARTAARILLES